MDKELVRDIIIFPRPKGRGINGSNRYRALAQTFHNNIRSSQILNPPAQLSIRHTQD